MRDRKKLKKKVEGRDGAERKGKERKGKGGKRKPRLITKSIRSKKETGKSIIIFFILKNTIILEYFYSLRYENDYKMLKFFYYLLWGKQIYLKRYIHTIKKSKTRKRKMIHQ